jgi:hypothetical protein
MSEENKLAGFGEDQQKAIEHAIKGIDIDAISKDEVFLDFIGRLKRFIFECSVALHLLEKKTLADMAENAKEVEVESKE